MTDKTDTGELRRIKAVERDDNALDLDLGPGRKEAVKMNEANARIK